MRIAIAALFAALSGIVFGYFVLSPGTAEEHAIPADA